MYCLRVLALFRFMNPTKEIRISGVREVNLRSIQPLGLYAANSIFIGDYLTTCGQDGTKDHEMVRDLGFEIDYENAEDFEDRSEEHTSELQSRFDLVCRLLLESK